MKSFVIIFFLQDYENKKCLTLNVDMHVATSGIVHMHMHPKSKKWKDVGDLWLQMRHSISLLFLGARPLTTLSNRSHQSTFVGVFSHHFRIDKPFSRGKTRQRASSIQVPWPILGKSVNVTWTPKR